ncbi:MAG: MarR family winged helix-turn-helix transcriptional regulator [Asticcacaulis sp.]
MVKADSPSGPSAETPVAARGKTPSQLKLDNQLCFAVYAAHNAFTAAYKPLLGPLGLTYPQYLVMMRLWEQDDLSVGDLGAPLHLDSGTLTPLLKRLQAAGLVTRTRDEKDERVTRIRLTETGWALRDKASRIPLQILSQLGLKPQEIFTTRDEVRGLSTRLRAANAPDTDQ